MGLKNIKLSINEEAKKVKIDTNAISDAIIKSKYEKPNAGAVESPVKPLSSRNVLFGGVARRKTGEDLLDNNYGLDVLQEYKN